MIKTPTCARIELVMSLYQSGVVDEKTLVDILTSFSDKEKKEEACKKFNIELKELIDEE